MTPASREIRRSILHASHASGHGHIPTSFSVVEMLCAVYDTMRHDPADPDSPSRDVFVLSKGHAALGMYAVLAHYGYLKTEELASFGRFASRLGCHPDRMKVPGIEVSTGSLGHGIGVATGIALAFRMQGSQRRVYTLVGDGEANEGALWEAVMIAAAQRLSNLTVLYDDNRSQVRSMQLEGAAARFAAFGFAVHEVDGHDLAALREALARPAADRPTAVIGRTEKGFGCRSLSSQMFEWHRKSPDAEQLSLLLGELDANPV